jgi:hypothetical protein
MNTMTDKIDKTKGLTMKEQTVLVRPDGSLEFVYQDEHPALDMGTAAMTRASDVTWDENTQTWKITLRPPWWITLPRQFKSRKEAIAFEVEVINRLLAGETMEEIFPLDS